MSDVRRFPDAEALARAAAQEIADRLTEAVAQRGRAVMALSGGSTPRRTYQLLGADERVPWGNVHLFWGDERWVAADAPESNQRLVRETLLASGQLPAANVHPVPAAATPLDAARAYAQELRRFFASEGPSFDVALQGLGEDGHTASLFPGDPAVAETGRWVVAVPRSPQPPILPRITVTLPLLNRSRTVAFLVAGPAKASTLAAVLSEHGGDRFPAARVHGHEATIWFVDDAAAASLPPDLPPSGPPRGGE